MDVKIPGRPLDRTTWKRIAIQAHDGFNRAGVDAVAYYHIDDINAGPEASLAISRALTRRAIKNIALLRYTIAGDISLEEKYELVITPYSGDHQFFSHGQLAWHHSDSTLEKVMLELYRDADKINIRTNLLLAEAPEFYEDTHLITGARKEGFPNDVKLFKMAVPEFYLPTMPANHNYQEMEELLVTDIEKRNEELKRLMKKDYPLEVGFTDPFAIEQDLRYKQGYHYKLCFIHSPGYVVKNMLNYKTTQGESSYISVVRNNGDEDLKNIPANQPVYKYYIKHIVTGNVFLGSEWDADVSWQSSLSNFLKNLKSDLNLRQ